MKCIYYLAFFLITESAFSAVPVTLSDPSPPIASSYSVGDSATVIYTITNNVPGLHAPITVYGISGPIARTSVTNDCENALPTGPSTCNIGILIAPTSANADSVINQNLYVNYKGRKPLVKNITFSIPPFTPPSPVLITVGLDYAGAQPPLVAASNDGVGGSWSVRSITNAPTSGGLFAAGCSGNGATALCVGAGSDFTGTDTPLVVVTTDGGSSWTVKNITGAPSGGDLFGADCTGSGSTGVCAVGGRDTSGPSQPFLAASTDGGNTWNAKTIAGLPPLGIFNAVSCIGEGPTAICAAAGEDLSTGTAPPIVVSTDGGNTWVSKSIAGLPATSYFGSISCTGSGASAICAAAGQDLGLQLPLVVVSTDGGNTWSSKTIPGAPSNYFLFSVSCTGSGSSAICVAAGGSPGFGGPPLVVVSTDGGNTWATKTITGSPTDGVFRGASCTGSGVSAVCTVAGQDSGTATPLVAVSTDGGNSWSVKSIPGITPTGRLNAASCTTSALNSICIASGEDLNGSQPPLLVESIDGGNTWSVVNVTGSPVSGGYFGTGATASLLHFPGFSTH